MTETKKEVFKKYADRLRASSEHLAGMLDAISNKGYDMSSKSPIVDHLTVGNDLWSDCRQVCEDIKNLEENFYKELGSLGFYYVLLEADSPELIEEEYLDYIDKQVDIQIAKGIEEPIATPSELITRNKILYKGMTERGLRSSLNVRDHIHIYGCLYMRPNGTFIELGEVEFFPKNKSAKVI